jgi:N-acetylmuramoyl-L-alanine amidase
MTNQNHKVLDTTPLADWIAGQIPNPLLRLRFLQTVMVRDDQYPTKTYKYWFLVSFLVVLLLFTAPTPEPRVRAANEIPRQSLVASLGPTTVRVKEPPEIWQVEGTAAFETYSNGLRIDNRFSIANHPRSYLAFSATRPEDVQGERRSVPAGIVFHTTESLQAPFEADQNSALKGIGESLLTYVRSKRAYHFLIDRFGRVYRVVRESDAANHAGNSIWSDADWLYLNLNQSFLAVSFETQTLPGQAEAAVNPAQVRSAAMLTDMLRTRYGIPAGNCVTHAQVSVNASNLRIGYHFDWASSFPFEQVGLPDNYALPLPAVSLAGFQYDSSFEHGAGARVYQEAELAEQLLRDHAAAAHLQVPVYRKALQKRYRKQLAVVRRDANQMDEGE